LVEHFGVEPAIFPLARGALAKARLEKEKARSTGVERAFGISESNRRPSRWCGTLWSRY
jgi:hypothetical protein